VKRPLPLFDFLHNQRSLNHCAYSQRSSRSSVVVQARDVIGFSSRQLSVRHLRERDGRPHTTAQSVNVGLLPSSLAARNAAKTASHHQPSASLSVRPCSHRALLAR
jgi:hypothetical protein